MVRETEIGIGEMDDFLVGEILTKCIVSFWSNVLNSKWQLVSRNEKETLRILDVQPILCGILSHKERSLGFRIVTQ
jgi:hypothetical protein